MSPSLRHYRLSNDRGDLGHDLWTLGRPACDQPGGLDMLQRSLIAASIGAGPTLYRWFAPRQTHSATVAVIGPHSQQSELEVESGFDALVTLEPDVMLTIRTADCLPLFLGAAEGVGLAHVGWRGLVGGVIEATVETMQAQRVRPIRHWRAAIGPHISAANYEVGPEVRAAALDRYGSDAEVGFRPSGRPGHWLCDMQALTVLALGRLGMAASAVTRFEGCTFAEPERWCSYRRDGAAAGRIVHGITV